jgi:hypothetical protein
MLRGDPRTTDARVPLTPAELERFKTEAALSGISLASWVRRACTRWADDDEAIRSDEKWQRARALMSATEDVESAR